MRRITDKDVLQKIFDKITPEDAKELLKLFIIEEKGLAKGHAFVKHHQAFLITDEISKTLGAIKSVCLSLEGIGIDGDDFTIELDDDVDIDNIVVDEVDKVASKRLEEIESGKVQPINIDLESGINKKI